MSGELRSPESPQLSGDTEARDPRPAQHSEEPDGYWFRGGYTIRMGALRRYLEKGHEIKYRPFMPAPNPRELEGTPHERLAKLKALWTEKKRIEFEFMVDVQRRRLPRIRSLAPPELRARLVIPCGIYRDVPHTIIRPYQKLAVYVSTSICPPTSRRLAAAAEDEERLKIFIDAMNELLPDDVRDEASLTLQDFTFASVAERFVHMPVFTDDCLQDMINYPSLARLYGIPPRYMLRGEITQKTLERKGLLD
ncbi:hypothetical protein GY45DRAFT_1327397 [Cubamyces sp. BRFM 1775]|nr:hypothetical protein GY45DRAFT_1327397 [Cubamyces sp. BRFM 1775]